MNAAEKRDFVEVQLTDNPVLKKMAMKISADVLGGMIAKEVWDAHGKEMVLKVKQDLKPAMEAASKEMKEKIVERVDGAVERFFDRGWDY